MLTIVFCVMGGSVARAQTPDASADKLVARGLSVIQQIESGQAEAVWEDAAPLVKSRFTKADLTAQFKRSREAVGSVFQRSWASVARIRYETATPEVTVGLYANVDFSTRLSDGRTVFELVSFRQEPDGNWHVTGYTLRQRQ